MFSALRKLTNRNSNGEQGSAQSGSHAPNTGGGVQTMAVSLQRKFARGVQYNSKCMSGGI